MTTTPRILVVEHEEKCPPARFGRWLAEAGCEVEVCRPHAGDALPGDLDGHDALLVLGGTMSANDDGLHAWLSPLKELIRDGVRDDVPMLGICLGHQLIATALGGEVRPNPLGQQVGLLELGWLPEAAADPLLGVIADPDLEQGRHRRGIQWNNDVITTLPLGAVVLARTARDEVQAARLAPTAWGIQLHPEADREITGVWSLRYTERHARLGIDTAAILDAIAEAEPELEETWRPLAVAFAGLAAGEWSTG